MDIDLLTTNDLHGFIAEQSAYFMNPNHPPKIIGGSGLYRYIEQNINKERALILDAGNFFQGHPMSVIDSGKTMIEFMNKVGYTALVPGSDDFVYGAKNLNQLAEISNFPFLISNLECNDCDLESNNFKTHIIKNIQGVTFGFIGIVDSKLDEKIISDKIKGITITDIKESIDE
jgi:2',3'-cyclic-nucleotide 2'-phosphodiesterase (5'-nucleotidase family)